MSHLTSFNSHRPAPVRRGAELLDALKQEFDTLSHDANLFKAQRDEYERKIQSQVQEQLALQQALSDLERVHASIKQQYEEEIRRLHHQIESQGGTVDSSRILPRIATGPTLPTYGGLLDSGTAHRERAESLPSLNPITSEVQALKLNGIQDKATGNSPLPPLQKPEDRSKTHTPLSTLPPSLQAQPPAPASGNDWMVGYNSAVNTKYSIELNHTLTHSSVVCCVRFSNDGKYLATGCNQTAQIYDTVTGQKIQTFSTDEPVEGDLYIRSVAFSTDSRFLATGAEDNKIRVFQINPKKLLQTLEGHELDIYSLDFSQDGRFIVSGSGDKKAIIWDIELGKALHVLGNDEVGPLDGVTSVAISPDGRYVAAGSLDRIVRLWDAHTGMFIERFDGHTDSVYSVCFSPDGKTLVSGSLDRTLKLWDLSGNRSRNRCQATFSGHKDFVLSVCFSPDGEWLISGSKDRSVQFWNPKTGVSHVMLQGHKNSVISVAHSPAIGSGILATGSGDCRARIWSYKKA